MLYSETVGAETTDPKRWRLVSDDVGATQWIYLDNLKDAQPQSSLEQYLLGLSDFEPPAASEINTALESAQKGADFFELLQDPSGCFPCLYQGPMFMTIGYLILHYYTKQEVPVPFKKEMIRFIINNSHPVDGGWGLHSSDKSTCFGTTINYIALRLLGLEPDHPVCFKARQTLHRLGGAVKAPHWGKIWLAVLNLYSWEGVNPAPPELWSLPYSLPIHPGKWWVHTRAIYLPVGYIQANKLQCELDPFLIELRKEIYLPKYPYEKIVFDQQRNNVCGIDLYYPHSKILNFANYFLSKWEKIRPNWVLNSVNKTVYDLIVKEFINTKHLCIAPVSYAFNVIAAYNEEGKDSENFKKLIARANDTVFLGPQGMTVMGTNGSQTWDASFMVQYFMTAGLADNPKYHNMIRKGFEFLLRSQFDDDCVPNSHRDPRKGGWPFSTKDQGYVVSDCTSEALKAIIMVANHPSFSDLAPKLPERNLYDAVDVILGLQNTGIYEYGSFSTYEKIKATSLLEQLNPAEVFNNIMVEYPYIECSDSSVLGLTYFSKFYPDYRKEEVQTAIENGIKYIMKSQEYDGSWYGAWGVCYTYAAMFALEAMSTVGLSYVNSATVKKGCDFLVSKQLPDGGWSESVKSCEVHSYVPTDRSLVVQTAWAVIGLLLADYPHKEPIARGIKLLMERQKNTGEWVFESTEGVFNHLCGIDYPNYKFLFPIKALGLYSKKYDSPN